MAFRRRRRGTPDTTARPYTVSKKSISPIPVHHPDGSVMGPTAKDSGKNSEIGSMPVPDLASIRHGWEKKTSSLPALPETLVSPKATRKATSSADPGVSNLTGIPELPSIAAVASKVALAMDDHEGIFDNQKGSQSTDKFPTGSSTQETPFVAPQPSSGLSPIPISAALSSAPTSSENFSSEPSIFELGRGHSKDVKKTGLNIPHLPEIAMPESFGSSSKNARKEHQKELSAMPTMAAPNVSIPLVRDQFITPQKKDLLEQPPAPTPLSPKAPEADSEIASEKTPESKAPPVTATESPESTSSTRSAESAERDTPLQDTPQYTDQDLREALRPIIDVTVDKFLYTPTQGIHTYLEPMLRSTVRRAIAEQMEEASPFRDVSGWDKFAWKMRALMGSRTYEDIVFNHTKRYQVEEVFLLRPHSRSLISYASHDPARHAKPTKVQSTIKKIAAKTAEKKQNNTGLLKWENNRQLLIRKGDHCMLAAIVHGSSNAILKADLDYALRQAEERFGKTLEEESDIHLQVLQPLLEGCLLIQSSAIPN